MTDTFDPTKPCRTRDGREVRILCTDAPGPRPIVAYVIYEYGSIVTSTWYGNGVYAKFEQHDFEHHELDLINTPERVTRWIGISSPNCCTWMQETWPDSWPQQLQLIFEDGKLIETKIHEA